MLSERSFLSPCILIHTCAYQGLTRGLMMRGRYLIEFRPLHFPKFSVEAKQFGYMYR